VPLANDLKPWLIVTPVLIMRGPTGRRAALFGWAAIALAAALAKAAEHVTRRARPGQQLLHDRLVAGDQPSSPSFPSTHTTPAVAFAGATIAATPKAAWAMAPLTVFVAWSRFAGGRHYPTDVAGGAIIGAAAAAIITTLHRTRR